MSGFGIPQLRGAIGNATRDIERLSNDVNLIMKFITTLSDTTQRHEALAFRELSGTLVETLGDNSLMAQLTATLGDTSSSEMAKILALRLLNSDSAVPSIWDMTTNMFNNIDDWFGFVDIVFSNEALQRAISLEVAPQLSIITGAVNAIDFYVQNDQTSHWDRLLGTGISFGYSVFSAFKVNNPIGVLLNGIPLFNIPGILTIESVGSPGGFHRFCSLTSTFFDENNNPVATCDGNGGIFDINGNQVAW